MVEIIVTQRTNGDEAIGAGLGETHEQAEARDAGDARRKDRADAVGKERRQVAVGRVALRRHGAAFEVRDFLADVAQGVQLFIRQPVAAEPKARISARWIIKSA